MNSRRVMMWLLVGFGALPARAQNVVIASGLTVTPTTVQGMVASPAPATQSAPVTVAAPITHPVPAYSGAYYGSPAYYPAPPHVYVYTPNVIYFGGPYSHLRNYYSGHNVRCYPYSSVVCFGRGEAWERGYYFQRWR